MKLNKSVLLAFGLLLIAASVYRVWPDRPYGFAPQMAMALFAGAVIRDRKWAIVLPIISMLISDVLYHFLFINGFTEIQGFYDGQWLNYALIAGLTVFGFLIKKISFLRVLSFSMAGSVLFFLVSNFSVWAAGGGYSRPKTFEGLMMCYNDGLAFFRDYGLVNGFYGNLFIGDLFFCSVLFGAFYLLEKKVFQLQPQRM